MPLYKIQLAGLVQGGHSPNGPIQQSHRRAEQIAEDSRNRHYNVDAGPPQLVQRNNLDISSPVQSVAARSDAQQAESLRNRLALGLMLSIPHRTIAMVSG